MAKGKHSAALFEVFHGTKGANPHGQAALKTPGWWFKGRGVAPAPVAVDPNDPTTSPIKSGLIAPRAAVVEEPNSSAPVTGAPVAASTTVVAAVAPAPVMVELPPKPAAPAPAAKPLQMLVRREPARIERDPADPTRPRAGIASASSAPRFALDHEHREVLIRMRVMTAIVAAFAIVVSIGFAYILGRRAATPPDAVADVDSSASLHTPPLQATTLDVPRRIRPAAAPAPRDDARAHEASAVPMANSVNGLVEAPVDTVPAVDGPRVIGVNYIIAQSYPNEQTADEARDFLTQHGVPCTVEQAPAGWPATWFSVVTRRGFEHVHTPDCESFKRQIQQLGEKFASKGQFKHFAPFPFAWKG